MNVSAGAGLPTGKNSTPGGTITVPSKSSNKLYAAAVVVIGAPCDRFDHRYILAAFGAVPVIVAAVPPTVSPPYTFPTIPAFSTSTVAALTGAAVPTSALTPVTKA